MKIRESMNVLLHKKTLRGFLQVLALALLPPLLSAQTPTLEIHELTVLKNDTLHFQFQHYGLSYAPQILSSDTPENGTAFFSPSSCCGGNGQQGIKGIPATNHLHYAPDNGFIGRDTFAVKYLRQFGNSGSQNAFKVFYILVVPSHLTAENDYAFTPAGQSIDIDVLSNDTGNGTNLTVADVPNVNHGAAVRINGNTQIRFTPAPGFAGVANLNYTICDQQGSCDMATVSIVVSPAPSPAYDSLFILTEKNATQVVLAEIDNSFQLVGAPLHGDIDTADVLIYIPNPGYTGYDKAVFHDPSGNRTRVVSIRILDVPAANNFLVDDIFYTSIGVELEQIRLLDNDKGGSYLTNVSVAGYPNTQQGGVLTYLPQIGKGVYHYQPPAGFSGIDRFRYKAFSPGSSYFEEAWCYIVVSNQHPALPVFQLSTPLNTPVVLGNHLPLQSYEYTNYSAGGDKGSVAFYPGWNTVTSQHGQTFSGFNMLVYEPDAGATGLDEFEFNYCPGDPASSPCPLVKVIVDIGAVSGPQCAGPDCVWAGDTNLDGVVDVRDILPIGFCMGDVGPARQNAGASWYGQYAGNWNSLQTTGLSYDTKHVDSDGNGIVSALDTTAISQSYGKYHNLTPEPVQGLSALPFYIQEPEFSNVSPGDILYAPIYLGNDTVHALNAYGLSFGIDYDPAFFEDVNIYFNDTAWMKYNSPILSMVKKPFAGKIDAGYTRTSGVSASGYGVIGVVEFIVIDDITGTRLRSNTTTVKLNAGGMMNGFGQLIGLDGNSFDLALKTNGAGNDGINENENRLFVYPNPGKRLTNVHLNGAEAYISRAMLYNLTGSLVFDSGDTQSKHLQLDLTALQAGVYTLKVIDSDGEIHASKVQVIR